MKVFLGGTVNNSTWRDKLIPELKIDYFNPVVDEWNDEAYQKELYEREHSDFCLYVLTPKMTGFYSIAEVADDSYKRPDRTVFCFLPDDDGDKFDDDQIKKLNSIGKKIEDNGAIWKNTLEEVAEFLNSGVRDITSFDHDADKMDQVFVSYGRKHSKDFAFKLHDRLVESGYSVWFDQNDIPLGVDFQEQINAGIKKADNFIFVISPHSVRSEYCLREIVLAVELNKRIIPLLHIEPKDDWDKMHPTIEKLNWIYFQEGINDFNASYKGLTDLVDSHKEYVAQHTVFLNYALEWDAQFRPENLLVSGEIQKKTEEWLSIVFDETQPPCLPTDLHCEFICEGKKLSDNLMTDIFISYDRDDIDTCNQIKLFLTRKGITSWVDTSDIKTGKNFAEIIKKGIEQADNLIFLISSKSIKSEYCISELKLAVKLHKRIIPLLIEKIEDNEIPVQLSSFQYLDFTDSSDKDFTKKAGELYNSLQKESNYHHLHKRLLVDALKWERGDYLQTDLLHGFDLEEAQSWLSDNSRRKTDTPTFLQKEFITKSHTSRISVFVSYGRRHSKDFATRLYEKLNADGFNVWFDQNDIPLGVDFQQQIDEGIEKADNFLYIISPHSVKSEFCLKEIVLAEKYKKRIIPILHVEPNDCWDLMHPLIAKMNWIYFREKENFDIPLSEWEVLDPFEPSYDGLVGLMKTHTQYVKKHTEILCLANEWNKKQQDQSYLLVGNERMEAEKWLSQEFKKTQPPCFPTGLHCDFICESKKNGNNAMTEVFFSYAREDKENLSLIRSSLHRHGITTWVDTSDIKTGVKFGDAINAGIEQADNLVFLITSDSVISEFCLKELEYALKFEKRIIPVRIQDIDEKTIPKELREIQYVDFVEGIASLNKEAEKVEKAPAALSMQEKVEQDVEQRRDKNVYEKCVDELINIVLRDKEYYNQHKIFLNKALKWQKQENNTSMLLRGFNLQGAEAWIKIGDKRSAQKPLPAHKKYIKESREQDTSLTNEVFVSYSRANSDFARKINEKLQIHDKTTWFDQESIASGSDFAKEINSGIETSDNFLFIITPKSIKSPYCDMEVEYARKFNKRFITILYEQVPPEDLHPELAKVQWINFKPDEVEFNSALSELINTLDTDRDHVQMHTKILQRAKEWKEKQEPADLLLRGVEFDAAENWMIEALEKEKKPELAALQTDYIEKSREAKFAAIRRERQRRVIKRMLFVMAALIVIAVGFGIYAADQSKRAKASEKLALIEKEKAIIAQDKAIEAQRQADSLRALAVLSEKDAINQKDIAKSAEIEANVQKNKAVVNERNALLSKREAELQKAIAQSEKLKADSAKNDAVIANERSIFQLYQFNSINMANKALTMQITPQTQEVAVKLSLTAYELQKEAQRRAKEYNFPLTESPEILEAMQQAVLFYESDHIAKGEVWDIKQTGENLVFSDTPGLIKEGNLQQNGKNILPAFVVKNKYQIPEFSAQDVVNTISVDAASKQIAAGFTSGKIMLVNQASNWKELAHINDGRHVWRVLFHNNKVISAGADKILRLINTIDNKTNDIELQTSILNFIVPDKNTLVGIDAEKTLISSNLNTIQIKNTGLKNKINTLANFDKLGKVVVGTNSGEIILLSSNDNYATVKEESIFPLKHKGIVSGIAFSSDKKWMATSSLDGTVFLWAIDNISMENIDRLIPVIIENDGRKIISVAFSSDNNYLLFGDSESLHIRPIEIHSLYKQIRNSFGDKTLSTEEWNYYKKGEIEKP